MEVKKVTYEKLPLTLTGPIAGDAPIYIYYSEKEKNIFYSTSLRALLNHEEIKKPLFLSELGLSFYLLSGVIPTPYTIYKDVFVLNIGDSVKISKKGDKLEFNFEHKFPFFNKERFKDVSFDEKILLELLKKAVSKKLWPKRTIYLFQSLGKDSNTIGLALRDSNFKDLVICLTLATGDRKDESFIASQLAKKMGFPHIKLYIPEKITSQILDLFDWYFENITHPCVDGTSLVYPIYATQIDFKGTNIIDGSGNDMYFGHVPRPIEFKRQKIYPIFSYLRKIADFLPTGNFLQSLTKTRSEMIGLNGFTLKDAKKIYPNIRSVFSFWKNEAKKRSHWDYFDLKADLWGTNVEFDLVIRKVRNFAEAFEANLILPWTDSEVASYIGKLPEKLLFDRKTFKNKLILRKLLKEKLGVDSDILGKYSYGFDAFQFLQKMDSKVKEEILNCKLWNKKEVEKIYNKLIKLSHKKLFRNLYVRLFILSAWFNHNRYIIC